jgi:hypothetical protein
MSHFSKITTRIVNKQYLIDALKRLNYDLEVGQLKCRGYNGNQSDVEILIKLTNNNYNLGFRRSGEFYELIADWYGIQGLSSNSLISSLEREITLIENKIKQKYAYETTIKTLEEQGFDLVEEVSENGEIHLQLRRLV